ncbi:hypothetical protein HMPREF9441_01162 [Paraprevotella clara YIT 11840]|uniref:DUF349 domain-containing protein n=2 Tax=Paraprevotella clara TaxID=454154 RepID=G5SNZ9_9BACT|nr:hypothetical protein HMPREF9441_01162 [Paraprevotella clara YIT 11840]
MNSKTESDTKTSNMMDSQETLQTEENVTENVAPEVNETENQTIEVPQTQEEVVARVKELAEADAPAEKQELDALKQAFYKIHKANVAAARAQFIENGGEPEAFLPTPNVLEDEFKAAMNVIKQKRAELQAELDRQKEENLQKKQEILERIKVLSATPEEANQAYKEFKELQNQWKELTLVPAEKANELWKTYQLYVEQYYDQLKLNNEFREYDFKKNLEIKTRLCETAEKLNEEADVISAFQQLQALHQEFKETGPVAKELREEIWARFKAASTAVNKRHQQYFEELKQKEEENLAHKTALCEKIEAVDLTAIKTAAAWEAQTQQIIEMQKEWRTIGFAPQKMNVKIFERFRGACDRFFTEKAAFFKRLKEEQAQNLAKKTELCEKAEALKDSTDWKATADKLMQIQKEWKTIGAVPKKHSESLWQRFIGACDYFFEQKGKNTASQRGEEKENLQKKEQVIEKLKALLESDEEENKQDAVRELMKEWNEIGFVPFKEKDKIYKAYHETVDQLFKALNMSAARRRLDNFKNNLKNDAKEGGQGLSRERERLVRAYENKRSEIKTYENNLGFLTCSSKKGSSLLNEMNKKMEKLKDELNLIGEKIAAIDKEMSAQSE